MFVLLQLLTTSAWFEHVQTAMSLGGGTRVYCSMGEEVKMKIVQSKSDHVYWYHVQWFAAQRLSVLCQRFPHSELKYGRALAFRNKVIRNTTLLIFLCKYFLI